MHANRGITPKLRFYYIGFILNIGFSKSLANDPQNPYSLTKHLQLLWHAKRGRYNSPLFRRILSSKLEHSFK
jgi:hypothetical protein